ncbi:GNAT family N-acetyltransferase [Marinomonas algicola]|uniref:GNAT family N-acetyltransferase n=1 Tax=Marinomonas algicola TaxID=2773454 RepID=UPI001749743C|nr:GNAT family N-acetyltransferase [Marinomonas algicola]
MLDTLPEFNPQPVTLSTDKVTLRPLTLEDAEGFYQAGNDPQLWQWVLPNQCESLATATKWIEASIDAQMKGEHVPFVIIERVSNRIIGSTRYCSIEKADRGIEIGFTFISADFQRSYVNTHAKFLLLRHAFEDLGAIRVQLKTHENNQRSRNAIARIGGVFEGILRHQRIQSDGTIRNTALFSLTHFEWPQVKTTLAASLRR